jgi:hypothetical protein
MKRKIDDLKIDENVYPRNGISDINVYRLISALRTGVKLPPITIEARTLRIVDGRHRYEAYKAEKLKTIEVVEKVYASEADLFADTVRLNVSHGEPLDQFNIRSAIVRLNEYGYSKEKISDVVRLPVPAILKIERGFATDAETGKPVALKGGLSHLRGMPLDKEQQQVNRHYSGPKAIFYLRQLISLLQNDMAPTSATFATEMDRLFELWRARGKSDAA